ncbi:DNA-directed RNA polymerase III subunit RPC9 [Sitodiplosis mosellana]|uniref:DNA-directed RNA polymerase III subunit RPC9 n=1 Tax=Sitodiplosis mosellana TaxID=263140 RepID=UPI0024437FAA|nr:DNA-directed RNA polymerase III subunit RPC9 [Sitodiplosis mosellana]
MEVVNPCYAILSNFEVMEALKDIKDQRSKFGLRNLATITYETIRYLEESPCKTHTKEKIMGFLNAVKPFKLTKAECMNLINDPPSTPLHIQLQIEDSEERLTEEAVNEIINLSREWLIPPPIETV